MISKLGELEKRGALVAVVVVVAIVEHEHNTRFCCFCCHHEIFTEDCVFGVAPFFCRNNRRD